MVSGGVWYVQGVTWGPDNVGWLPASVQYIQQHPGQVNIPCDATIHQALDILCPGCRRRTSIKMTTHWTFIRCQQHFRTAVDR